MQFSRHCLRFARQQAPTWTRVPAAPLCSLGGLPSQFEVHPRTQQLIDDINSSVLSFGQGQNYSKDQDVEVTGNAMTLDSLIALGGYVEGGGERRVPCKKTEYGLD